MLERSIGAAQKAEKILVHAAFWFIPNLVKCTIVIRSRSAICTIASLSRHEYLNVRKGKPLEDKFPSAAALFPCTSELDEFVRGINTSQMPISSN
jgi:hypothetical protein